MGWDWKYRDVASLAPSDVCPEECEALWCELMSDVRVDGEGRLRQGWHGFGTGTKLSAVVSFLGAAYPGGLDALDRRVWGGLNLGNEVRAGRTGLVAGPSCDYAGTRAIACAREEFVARDHRGRRRTCAGFLIHHSLTEALSGRHEGADELAIFPMAVGDWDVPHTWDVIWDEVCRDRGVAIAEVDWDGALSRAERVIRSDRRYEALRGQTPSAAQVIVMAGRPTLTQAVAGTGRTTRGGRHA